MKNAKVSQLQPMSISVQSGDTTSANTVSSTSKIDNNPKDDLNKDNPQDCAQKNAPEQNVKKTKTIQHLLSDWRTAYAMTKKVILLDLSFYLILLICFQETTAGNTNTTSFPNNYNHQQMLNFLGAVYPSKDVKQKKAVFNPITQEFRFISEQVHTFTLLFFLFIFYPFF